MLHMGLLKKGLKDSTLRRDFSREKNSKYPFYSSINNALKQIKMCFHVFASYEESRKTLLRVIRDSHPSLPPYPSLHWLKIVQA